MRVLLILVSLSILIGACGCTSGEGSYRAGYDFASVEKIAIVEVTGFLKREEVRNQIASFFEMGLLERGYAPVERARVQFLLDEQDFQASEVTTSEEAVQAGKILNVPVVLLIDIPEFGENINISAKMLDVEDGSILWVSSGTGRTGKILTTALAATAGAIIGASVDSDHSTEGAVIGGVIAGAAGYQLSPQAAEKIKAVIDKMCDTLPSGL
jgi:hypothetical protein